MRKIILIILILLFYSYTEAGTDWCMEHPSGVAIECYTPGNPPPGGSSGYLNFTTNETADINWTHDFTTTGNGTFNNITSTGYFIGDGSLLTGVTGGNATPGGSDTQVQFNDDGNFSGESNFTYNKALDTLSIDRIVIGPGVADYVMPTVRGAAGEVLKACFL